MAAGGKGHAPRPYSVTQEEYAARFEAIFGKKKGSENESKQGNERQSSNSEGRSEHGKDSAKHSSS